MAIKKIGHVNPVTLKIQIGQNFWPGLVFCPYLYLFFEFDAQTRTLDVFW